MFFFGRKKGPVIRQRKDHCISRKNIDPDALKVLYRLSASGHTAYLVGGGVRDLLLGRTPKDFDVGTDASPNEIRRIFRNCFLIGRRFRLAQIIFGKKVIETSTFRAPPQQVQDEDGMYQTDDNTFGTPEEDARRRDFTVNGLFYDIKTFAVIDYVGGLKDLEKKLLRCIGDPEVRFREDPVRMMRAVKFASRLGFTIDKDSLRAIRKYHSEIRNAPVPRVCEEVYRLFPYRASAAAFRLLWENDLTRDLLPELDAHIRATGGAHSDVFNYLAALDHDELADDASNGLRTAVLFYSAFKARYAAEAAVAANRGRNRINTMAIARQVLSQFCFTLKVPKVTFFRAITMFDMQRRLMTDPQPGGRDARMACHPDFPEALALRRIVLTAEGQEPALCLRWQKYAEGARANNPRNRPQPVPALSGDHPEAGELMAEGLPPFDEGPRRHHHRGGYRHHAHPEDRRANDDHAPVAPTDQPPPSV